MDVRIKKIEIVSFGKLKNVVVNANEGINILSAPNESGKTTLASFIKFVFYGFVGGRMQSLTDNERKLYTPWDGEVSEGSVTVCADDTEYIIHRRCAPSGKETVEVTNRISGANEFVGEVPGEVLFGVGEEIFSRTVFFRQMTLPQSKDEVLADRLRDIAISADEQVSTKKAVSRLNDSKNELKGRAGNGLIPRAERERDELEQRISEAMELREESMRLREAVNKRLLTITEAEQRLADLKKERKNIEKYEAVLALRKLNRLSVEEDRAREEYERVSAGLKKQADGSAFGALSAKNAEYVAQQRSFEAVSLALKDAERDRDAVYDEMPLDDESAKQAQAIIKRSEKTAKLLFILAAVSAVVGLLIYFATSSPAGFLGLALAVVIAAVGGVMLGKPAALAKEYGLENTSQLKTLIENLPVYEQQLSDLNDRIAQLQAEYTQSREKTAQLKSELDAEIGKYADLSDGDYSQQIEYILSASAESGEKLALWRAKKQELDNAKEGIDVDALAEEAKGAVEPERDRAQVDRDISFYSGQYTQLSELNRRDELEITALEARGGDLAVMVGKRDALDARIAELSLKHKAYEKAIKAIEDAGNYMKSMVAPRIGERADEYFTAATGGKYSSFEVDTKLSMSFGEDFRRSCDYLSAGTRDSAYLSLRLALADMLFGGCGVPILLDDAFGRIDDSRLRMMSGALASAAKKHQLFILTHGSREKQALSDIGAEFSEIEIKQID